MAEVETGQELRFETGMRELDRVLGGGAVQGSLVLVGGAPGIGKSTLMLQICDHLCRFAKVLYVSGEESERQIKLRADRLHVQGTQLYLQAETNLTGGFDIEYGEESFTVTPKGGVDDVLKGVYPNNEIGDCEGKGYADMYSLVITSYNGEATVTVHFSAYEEVCEITLDKEVIVF